MDRAALGRPVSNFEKFYGELHSNTFWGVYVQRALVRRGIVIRGV